MKNKVLFACLTLLSLSVVGQEPEREKKDSVEKIICLVPVVQIPQFPGGEEEMVKYIQRKMKYPSKAKLEGRGGISYITFIVEKNGRLSHIKLLKASSGGNDLDEEALRIVKSMPRWKPGTKDGKKVKMQMNLPVRFIGV